MGKVKKVFVLSDIHLGKDKGYLFSEHPDYLNNCKALTEIFDAHQVIDELILNGDILDLALAGLDIAYKEMKQFFKFLAGVAEIKRIVYLPGNHDHHIWRILGEQIYVHEQLKRGQLPPGHGDYSCRFVDQRYSSLDPHHQPYIVFPYLWPEGYPVPEFVVKYPHHLLKIGNPENDGISHYLITHGHFLEEMFKPINYLIEPNRLAQLEAFNNMWLETFDYHIGHSDELSKKIRELEKRFLEGGKEAKKKVKDILDAVYANMKKKIGFKFPITCVVKYALKRIIKLVPKEKMGQSMLRGAPVNQKLLDSIENYIVKYIIQRYTDVKPASGYECEDTMESSIPLPFTFIFGHTHVPFSRVIDIDNQSYPIWNTGGWIRNDGDGSGNGKYAGILIIDHNGASWKSLNGKLK
jgi:UDP-2,3-diacylglucosamine pyrophosphatase LpxH